MPPLSPDKTLPYRAPEGLPPNLPGYEILGELGRGGMGVVFKARQLSLNRVVALKMVLAGSRADPEGLARFRREAEAVAALQHPNIVQIYEVGEHEGRPFFSLEFCPGGSLERRVRRTPLPPAEAARLLVTLAHAVHYAHERGVVHRDLKPANILLAASDLADPAESQAADLIPKVTDFGLAKRLETPGGQSASGQLLGTPSYMAPEQARGDNQLVGPLADVWALGATLYELLTGRPPFLGASWMETLGQVLSQEPVPPRRLQPGVPRDLQTICLKCLHKEPARRYGSAAALAKDLERFLADEPIKARPTSRWERVVKWARRRPAVAALIGVSALTVVSLLAVSLWFNVKLTAEAERAEANLLKARSAVDHMYTQVAEKWLAQEAQLEEVQREFLEKALGFYTDFLREQGGDPAVLEETARAHRRVADIQMKLGRQREAERAYREALTLVERLAAGRPGQPAHRQELAAIHARLGTLFKETSRPAEAEGAFRQAVAVQEVLVAEFTEAAAYRQDLALSHNNLGIFLLRSGRPEEAEQAFRDALRHRRLLAERHPQEAEYRSEVGGTLNNLAVLLRERGELMEALSLLRQAIAHQQRALRANARHVGYRRFLRQHYWNAANTLELLGESAAAEGDYRRTLTESEKLVADFPRVPNYANELGRVLNDLAALLSDRGQFGEARQMLERALRHQQAALKSNPDNSTYRRSLHSHHWARGKVLARSGAHAAAEEAYHQALDVSKGLTRDFPRVPEYWQGQAALLHDLGWLLLGTGRRQQAGGVFRQALALQERLVSDPAVRPADRWELANSHNQLARALADVPVPALRDSGRAVALAEKAVALSPRTGLFWNTLGLAHCRAGDWKAGVVAVTRGMERRGGGSSLDWFVLAIAHARLGEQGRARLRYEQAVRWMETRQPSQEELQRLRAEAAALLGVSGKLPGGSGALWGQSAAQPPSHRSAPARKKQGR
jgi:serine/threonine protein kinase/Tfp pilus assembly protein PilF